MAIGLMRMFGFRILENFNYPYIARSIREFWRRWHISLSNWFRDYLYIPLGGNQRGERRAYANLVIVFLLCGLWHGASWPFVLWGAWHGLFLVAERAGVDRLLRRAGPVARLVSHAYALLAVMGGWVLFRCDTLAHAVDYFQALGGFAAAAGVAPFRSPNTWIPRSCARWCSPRCSRHRSRGASAHGAMAWRRRRAWRPPACSPPMSPGSACVGVVASAFLAAGTYNPFIYFRF